MTLATGARHVGQAAAIAVLGIACGLVVALATGVDAAFALLPVAAVVAGWLVLHPRMALAALVVPVVLLEDDARGFLPQRAEFYQAQGGLPLPAPDLLLLVLLAAVALDLARARRRPRLPGPFTLPLLVLVLAIAAGAVSGLFGGAGHGDFVIDAHSLVFLVLVAFLAADVLADDRARRAAILVGASLAAVKGLEGVTAWTTGSGHVIHDSVQSFLEPTANWVMLVFLLVLLGALLLRVPVGPWAALAGPLALAALVLSFRRSFWIGAVVGIVVVVLVVGGRRCWRLLPVALVAGAALWLGTALGGPSAAGFVVDRGRSLAPSAISSNVDDRYRLVEQRNVAREILRSPVAGLGLGVPWKASEPMPVEHVGGRLYTHVAVLWYWLKLGILGMLAYVLLVALAAFGAYRIFRLAKEPLVRAVGIGLAAAFAALAVIELTASFTGVDLRLSIVVAVVLGWIAAEGDALAGAAATPGEPRARALAAPP